MSRSPLNTLLEVFATVPSSRAARGTRYPLGAILALVLIGILSGCKNYSQIYVFAQNRRGLLERLGFRQPKYPRKRRPDAPLSAPNEDTLARNLASIPPQELNGVLARFLGQMVRRGSKAAIDGKALRGSDEYILSVFANDICQVVWQEDVGEKENELSCLEHSLQTILAQYPNLRLFTGDAAFCHKSVARSLQEAKRDYFLQLKAPHNSDLALAQSAFKHLRTTAPLATTVEKRGLRKEPKS